MEPLYVLTLCKGHSYTYKDYQATKDKPEISVRNKEDKEYLVGTGFFKMIGRKSEEVADGAKVLEDDDLFSEDLFTAPSETEEQGLPGSDLHRKTVPELKEYAKFTGVNVSGLSKKDDIVAALMESRIRADEARAALREE